MLLPAEPELELELELIQTHKTQPKAIAVGRSGCTCGAQKARVRLDGVGRRGCGQAPGSYARDQICYSLSQNITRDSPRVFQCATASHWKQSTSPVNNKSASTFCPYLSTPLPRRGTPHAKPYATLRATPNKRRTTHPPLARTWVMHRPPRVPMCYSEQLG